MPSLRAFLPLVRSAAVLTFAVGLLAAAGCSHYQLGTGTGTTFHTIFVEPVENKSTAPQAREILSTRLREAFARDGRVSIVNSANEADVVLATTIVDYHRTVAAVREGDTGLARKFDVTLGVECTLRGRDGTAIFDKRLITGEREMFTDAGQLQAEYQTMPLLADVVAEKIKHATLDRW